MWTLCNQTFSVHRINLQERNDQFRFQFLSDTEPRQAYPAGAVVSVLVRNMPRASVMGRSSRRAVSPRRRLLISVGARARPSSLQSLASYRRPVACAEHAPTYRLRMRLPWCMSMVTAAQDAFSQRVLETLPSNDSRVRIEARYKARF